MNINNVRFSNTSLWDSDKENVLIKFSINEYINRKYTIKINGVGIISDIYLTGNTVSYILLNDKFTLKENTVSIILSDGVVVEETLDFIIYKDNRESFTIKKDFKYNEKYIENITGDIIVNENGYVLNSTGQGSINIPINTDGKSKIKNIKINGLNDSSAIITDNFLMNKDSIDNITHEVIFSKNIDLVKYDTIKVIKEV